jgi:hypothetical protein
MLSFDRMNLDINFFDASSFDKNLKATIHSTGKLGFTDAAIQKFKLTSEKGALIGQNNNDNSDTNLYMKIIDQATPNSFKFAKAGAYYYLSTKTLFDNLQYDYKRKSIKFDIVEMSTNGETIYKMIKREDERRKEEM